MPVKISIQVELGEGEFALAMEHGVQAVVASRESNTHHLTQVLNSLVPMVMALLSRDKPEAGPEVEREREPEPECESEPEPYP